MASNKLGLYVAGSKVNNTMSSGKRDFHISEMDFMSTIITEDEYSVSKMPSGSTETASNTKFKEPKEKMSYMDLDGQLSTLENPPVLAKNGSEWKSSGSIGEKSKIIKKDCPSIQEVPSVFYLPNWFKYYRRGSPYGCKYVPCF